MVPEHRLLEGNLAPATRVRVLSRTPFLQLRSDLGRIVRKDQWADYYIVRLDEPATYCESGRPIEELAEIRLDVSDLEVIS